MEQSLIPIALISVVLMFFVAYMVATYVHSMRYKQFVLPQFEDYAVHMSGCGLLYPAIFVYISFGLTKLI